MITRLALLGLSAIAAACGASSSSGQSTGGAGAGAAAGTGGATGGGAGAGGSAGKGVAGGGASGAAGRGGTAGASGGGAAGGAAGDAGSGGAPRAGAGNGGDSGESGASGNGGAGGDDTPSNCRTDGCPSGTECLPVDGSCGGVACQDPDGACVDRPVCGCDGTIYPSNCAARSAGVGTQGVVSGSRCATPPSGYFDCLGLFCDSATEYCDAHRHYGSATFPFPCEAGDPWVAANCHPLPAACDPDATCGCVASEPFDAGGPTMICSQSCSDTNGVARYCQSGCYG